MFIVAGKPAFSQPVAIDIEDLLEALKTSLNLNGYVIDNGKLKVLKYDYSGHNGEEYILSDKIDNEELLERLKSFDVIERYLKTKEA